MSSGVALNPQLLSRASEPPAGEDWLHEIKYDGYRLLASVERGRVRLISRSGADWTARLPLIAKALAAFGAQSAILDGELVFLTNEGFPDFERLRAATQSSNQASLYYQAFDLLTLNGRDLTVRPLIERKHHLERLLQRGASNPPLRYVAHAHGNGAAFSRAADQLGLEGVVSKRAMSLSAGCARSRLGQGQMLPYAQLRRRCLHNGEERC